MPDRRAVGAAAEERAAQHLVAAGLKILHRNYRCRMGELDLVACETGLNGCGSVLVIAEVRLRSSERFGGAGASITAAKRRRIVRSTRHLLARFPSLQTLSIRFDALLVPSVDGTIDWVRSAFDAF